MFKSQITYLLAGFLIASVSTSLMAQNSKFSNRFQANTFWSQVNTQQNVKPNTSRNSATNSKIQFDFSKYKTREQQQEQPKDHFSLWGHKPNERGHNPQNNSRGKSWLENLTPQNRQSSSDNPPSSRTDGKRNPFQDLVNPPVNQSNNNAPFNQDRTGWFFNGNQTAKESNNNSQNSNTGSNSRQSNQTYPYGNGNLHKVPYTEGETMDMNYDRKNKFVTHVNEDSRPHVHHSTSSDDSNYWSSMTQNPDAPVKQDRNGWFFNGSDSNSNYNNSQQFERKLQEFSKDGKISHQEYQELERRAQTEADRKRLEELRENNNSTTRPVPDDYGTNRGGTINPRIKDLINLPGNIDYGPEHEDHSGTSNTDLNPIERDIDWGRDGKPQRVKFSDLNSAAQRAIDVWRNSNGGTSGPNRGDLN